MDARSGIADYHVHSHFSDGRDGFDACVERALALGLSELGFSEHLAPGCLGEKAAYGLDHARLEEYLAAVRATAAKYSELRVLCGIEADYVPDGAEEIARLLASYPFDYVLCSVHFVDGFAFNDVAFRRAPEWNDPAWVFRRYWELVLEAARGRLFTAVAHPDLPKRWGHTHNGDLSALENEALAALAAGGTAIEINTAGLDRHPVAEMYPEPDLLRRAHVAGVPVILGSDAHSAGSVGSQFASAVRLAREAGYDSWLRLSDHQPVALP